VFYRLCVSTDPGLASPGVGVRVAVSYRDGWMPGGARGTGLALPRVSTRVTEPGIVVEKALKGQNPRRAPTDDLNLAKGGVVAERTPGGSKASKWACRPSTGEPSVHGRCTVRAACFRARRGDRTSDREEPSSQAHASRSASGWVCRAKSSARTAKAIVNLPRTLRWRRSNANPQGSRRPARAGTAPREGKAL